MRSCATEAGCVRRCAGEARVTDRGVLSAGTCAEQVRVPNCHSRGDCCARTDGRSATVRRHDGPGRVVALTPVPRLVTHTRCLTVPLACAGVLLRTVVRLGWAPTSGRSFEMCSGCVWLPGWRRQACVVWPAIAPQPQGGATVSCQTSRVLWLMLRLTRQARGRERREGARALEKAGLPSPRELGCGRRRHRCRRMLHA